MLIKIREIGIEETCDYCGNEETACNIVAIYDDKKQDLSINLACNSCTKCLRKVYGLEEVE
jgi:MinD superfamily P-loop ATPase